MNFLTRCTCNYQKKGSQTAPKADHDRSLNTPINSYKLVNGSYTVNIKREMLQLFLPPPYLLFKHYPRRQRLCGICFHKTTWMTQFQTKCSISVR